MRDIKFYSNTELVFLLLSSVVAQEVVQELNCELYLVVLPAEILFRSLIKDMHSKGVDNFYFKYVEEILAPALAPEAVWVEFFYARGLALVHFT